MVHKILVTGICLALLPVLYAGCASKDCGTAGTCGGADVDGSAPGEGGLDGGPGITDGDVNPVEGGSTVDAPPGCDPKKAPTSAACVSDAVGIFVDASASDGNAGTKASPVASITKALSLATAQKGLIFICDGTYAEKVVVSAKAELFGGFVCKTWVASTNRALVQPVVAGYALDVQSVTSSVAGGAFIRIENIEFDAAAGDSTTPNSIAARTVKSNVNFTNVKLVGGTGAKGATGDAGTTGTVTNLAMIGGDINGYGTATAAPGGIKSCTCSTGGTSSGGSGGAVNSDGQKGGPNIPENPLGMSPPWDGAPGTGNTNCGTGGLGHTGATAAVTPPAAAPTVAGSGVGNEWVPANGYDGIAGKPGQGGGGGGGKAGGGGGGACGGCGGVGGKGGGGGGASIAVLALESNLKFSNSVLAGGLGGIGGTGGGVGPGAVGGSGGGSLSGCGAGDGGQGANGAAGSGGSGGVSVAVVYRTNKPARGMDTSVSTTDTTGNKGIGGAVGTNDGPDGTRTDELLVP